MSTLYVPFVKLMGIARIFKNDFPLTGFNHVPHRVVEISGWHADVTKCKEVENNSVDWCTDCCDLSFVGSHTKSSQSVLIEPRQRSLIKNKTPPLGTRFVKYNTHLFCCIATLKLYQMNQCKFQEIGTKPLKFFSQKYSGFSHFPPWQWPLMPNLYF